MLSQLTTQVLPVDDLGFVPGKYLNVEETDAASAHHCVQKFGVLVQEDAHVEEENVWGERVEPVQQHAWAVGLSEVCQVQNFKREGDIDH